MLIAETIVVSVRGMMANKTRTLLTMLGIVVGVGSVIVLIAFSEGTKRELLRHFEEWGANRMGIYLDKWNSPISVPESENLTYDDILAIRENCSTIRHAVPYYGLEGLVRFGGVSLDKHTIVGTEPEVFSMMNLTFADGGPFTLEHNLLRERVCVLASNTKYSLFFEADALDQFIIIDGKRFRVIGVLREKGGSRWSRIDDQVIIPYFTAHERLGERFPLREIHMAVTDNKYCEYAEEQVREVMHLQHPLIEVPEDPDNDPIRIWNAAEWAERQEQTANSFAKFLIVMGALSLLIGGVGVMNIMLVSVQERTREIGLRKAVGATGFQIMFQFLVESVTICLVGGSIGTFGAVIAARYLARLPEEAQVPDPIVTTAAIAVAVIVTVAVGLFFGVYPAVQASRLDPIKALSYE